MTQQFTYDYIINKGFTTPSRVEYIYGIVTHPEYFRNTPRKKYFKKDKNTFDICFVAHKYMLLGLDKEYDMFIAVCKKLAACTSNILFHVAGNFDRNEINVDDMNGRIIFYGLRDPDFFPGFYSGMDIILFPSKARHL
ncbi:MAG: hypothetical protein QHH06_06100 [Clostridiales bacterium]|nr:hypothetical protein [Eubacteriales bacterium]MDH7566035.1 hypothetical protein [Clostridiales bacterium]